MTSETWVQAWTAANTTDHANRPRESAGPGWRAAEVPIGQVMACDPLCLAPTAPLERARQTLLDRGVMGAPVIDELRRPLGILCMSDLAESPSSAKDVRDVMTPFVFSLPAHAGLARAAALMAYEDVDQLVVTGRNGTVVGLLSTLDVASWFARRMGYLQASAAHRGNGPGPASARRAVL